MAKGTFWFKHDHNARHDPKLTKLRRIKGMKGLGIYWCLIEILHEQGGEMALEEIGSISFEFQEDEGNVMSVIKEFGLFEVKNGCVRNARVMQSLKEREGRSKKAVDSANQRWSKKGAENKPVNANAMRTHSERNAIRGEEIREDNINKDTAEGIIQAYTEKWMKQTIWIESICLQHRMTPEQIPATIKAFFLSQISAGAHDRPERDLKRHFSYWIAQKPKESIEEKPIPWGPEYAHLRKPGT